MTVLMMEDAELSLMFGNSEELEHLHLDSCLLRVSETTERMVSMGTTESTDLLL